MPLVKENAQKCIKTYFLDLNKQNNIHNIPKSFVAGEAISWSVEILNNQRNNLQAPEADLNYILCNSNNQYQIKADYIGGCYHIKLTSPETLIYAPGTYWWQCFYGTEQDMQMLASGEVIIKPNFVQIESYDGRSHARKVLDALESTLEGKATRDQLSYSIAGRSLSRMSPVELLEWRDKYKAEETMLKRKSGQDRSQLIKVRF
ncbi:MAG: hypothetical protein DGJ47_000546 [Rickettsiaceae bacterium]